MEAPLLDHVMVLNEEHLKRLLNEFIEDYYHLARPHQGLNGDTPIPSAKPESAGDGSRFVSTRCRRFASPLHPSGRLIFHSATYSTKRPQNKTKPTQSGPSLEPAVKGIASSEGRLAYQETRCDARR